MTQGASPHSVRSSPAVEVGACDRGDVRANGSGEHFCCTIIVRAQALMLNANLSSNLGTKRRCFACEAPFYDLNRDPITCPKCGAPYQAVARLKSDGREPPKGRTFTRRKPVEAAAAPSAEAPEQIEDDLDRAEDDEADAPDEEDAEDEDDRVDGDDQEIEPGDDHAASDGDKR
jgi:uncharacterized protein (TIGR02300 family)